MTKKEILKELKNRFGAYFIKHLKRLKKEELLEYFKLYTKVYGDNK